MSKLRYSAFWPLGWHTKDKTGGTNDGQSCRRSMTFILFLLYCRRYAMRKGGGYRKSGNDGRNSSVEDWIPYSSTFSYLLNVAVSLRAPCRRSRWEVDVTESNSPFWLTTSFPGYTLPAGHLRQCICTTDRASREVGHAIQPWTRLDRLCVVSTKEALPHGHCLAIVCASKGKVSRAKTLSLLVLPYNNNNYIYCQLPHPEKIYDDVILYNSRITPSTGSLRRGRDKLQFSSLLPRRIGRLSNE